MAKTRQQKETEVATLTEQLQRMKVAVFATASGLKVKDVTALRTQLRTAGVDYVVVKKTLLRRALEAAALSAVDVSGIVTSFAIAFGYDDEVTPARLLAQFGKTHESLKLLGGILDGRALAAPEAVQLAALPTRDELRARLVGTIAGPIRGLVTVLSGNLRGLVRVLSAVSERRATTAA